MNKFEHSLKKCISIKIREINIDITFDSFGNKENHYYITLDNNVKIKFIYWRLFSKKHNFTSYLNSQFDKELIEILTNKVLIDFQIKKPFNDLLILLESDLILQIFSLTNLEDWIINFPDGTEDYSNHQD